MKKVYLLFICLVFISSCNDDLVMERNDILSTNNIEISIHDSLLMNKDLVLKKDFAKALSKVFNESLMARNLIKNEALKMIDNDYDVLYQLVKDEMLEDNITFEQYIGKYIEMGGGAVFQYHHSCCCGLSFHPGLHHAPDGDKVLSASG